MTDYPEISPLEGKPYTRMLGGGTDDGYRIVIRELTPIRAKWVDALMSLGVLFWGYTGFSAVMNEMPQDLQGWTLVAVTFLGPCYAWRTFLHFIFKASTVFEITTDRLRVRQWTGSRSFDRSLQHRFALLDHDGADKERVVLELRARKDQSRGRYTVPQKYYSQSYHLVFEHLGQRRDIATIYGHKAAKLILDRIKLCDQLMDTKSRASNGTVTSPDDQWGDQTGEIPEE